MFFLHCMSCCKTRHGPKSELHCFHGKYMFSFLLLIFVVKHDLKIILTDFMRFTQRISINIRLPEETSFNKPIAPEHC